MKTVVNTHVNQKYNQLRNIYDASPDFLTTLFFSSADKKSQLSHQKELEEKITSDKFTS